MYSAPLILVDALSGLLKRCLVRMVRHGPLHLYVGMCEPWVAHDRRRAIRFQNLFVTTFHMAAYQARVLYRLLRLALGATR